MKYMTFNECVGNIGAMRKSNCVGKKCRFYDDVNECAIDCCMYGASAKDEEIERGCCKSSDSTL